MTGETLEKKIYPYMDQSLYHATLQNGLSVYLFPTSAYHETFGVLTTDFGSVHRSFKPKRGEKWQEYPAGMAHFLEHTLFEKEDRADMLYDFAKLGATANAMTDFSQTSYFFSTLHQVENGVRLLQKLAGEAYFSQESVDKEKKIIQQEIEMYWDAPDERLFMEILASLYPQTALADDIAGTVDSISQIEVADLYEHFRTFYHPNRQTLFVMGNFELESVWQEIVDYQEKRQLEQVEIDLQPLTYAPVLPPRSLQLEVASPKLAVGIRGNAGIPSHDFLAYKINLSLFFSLLLGWTSGTYRELYDSGKIDASFSIEMELQPDYQFVLLTVDTEEPILVSNVLRKTLQKFAESPDMTEEHLSVLKKEMYGQFMRQFHSLEQVASQFVSYPRGEQTMFDIPQLVDGSSLTTVLEAGQQFLTNCDMTDVTIFPK